MSQPHPLLCTHCKLLPIITRWEDANNRQLKWKLTHYCSDSSYDDSALDYTKGDVVRGWNNIQINRGNIPVTIQLSIWDHIRRVFGSGN